jgi:Tol biopolymer transport system component
MKLKPIFITLMLSSLTMSSKSYSQDEYPKLEGPYMGQKPPGMVAEPFAHGVISTDGWDVQGAFSPDGKRMHMAKGYKDRISDGWTERKSLGPLFDRKDFGIMRMSASAQGSYVFDDYISSKMRISMLKNGKRQAPEFLNKDINSGEWTAYPFIAPDESYLIWDSEREGGYGGTDFYISFKQKDGAWGSAINMGDKINSDKEDSYATVTPDGKYILFNRKMDDKDNMDLYWVDAKIIEMLRPKQ